MTEEDQRREVLTVYDNVKNQIMEAIFRSSANPFYLFPLKDLQKTVHSMEPMVEDMEVSEITSPRYKFMSEKFLPLLEKVIDGIRCFLSIKLPVASFMVVTLTASICHAFGIKLLDLYMLANSYKNDLAIIKQELRYLFADYIKEELYKLAMSNEEVVDEGVLGELLRYLLSKFRDEASKPSSKPVFRKIELLLSSLETDFYSIRQQSSKNNTGNMVRLLILLKEVKLLHRFLDGDHGLDIPNHLRESENALRMFVTDDALSQLNELEVYHEKVQREKDIAITFLRLLLVVLMFGCLLNKAEDPNRPIDLVAFTAIAIFIVLLGYTLAMQVFTRVRWERSHNQGRSLNAENTQLQGEKEIKITSLWLLLAVLILACLLDIPEYPDHPSECVVIIVVVIFIVRLAYSLATQVFYQVRLGRSRSHDLHQSSISNNPELQREKEMQKEISKTFWLLLLLLLAVFMLAFLLNKPDYPNRPSDFVIVAVGTIFMAVLAYTLTMQVTSHLKLGWYPLQIQSSIFSNPQLQREKEMQKEISKTFWLQLLLAVFTLAYLLPSDFVIVAVGTIFMAVLAYTLTMQVTTPLKLGRSPPQIQSSNFSNPRETREGPEEHKNAEYQKEDLDLPLFDYDTIATATDNFSISNKIGEGGFGPVYKGTLIDGQEIAVKRLSENSIQGPTEFKNEVICIFKLQHRNLVKLLGCCIHVEKMLIYEYMPNRSLDSFIFDKTKRLLLDWPKRFNIINGISQGLLYLHQDSRLRIIHRDLKAGNILLDHEMNPKISDFGMARSFRGNETEAETTRVVGTYGYMSPEYAINGLSSRKSDVFSFGVLVLEIMSGKKNRGFQHEGQFFDLLGHAWKLYQEDRSFEMIDASVEDSCNYKQVLRSIHVGLLCVQRSPEDRPSMSDVVLMLSSEGALPTPTQPGFFNERHILGAQTLSNNDSTSAGITVTLLSPR